jgi:FKBP-type peptidyl-prolyl cis-trans isomerase FkpA
MLSKELNLQQKPHSFGFRRGLAKLLPVFALSWYLSCHLFNLSMEKAITLCLLANLTLINVVLCQDSTFQTTDSGLLYKIYSNKMGSPASKGGFLKYYWLEGVDDSLLLSTYGSMPVYMRIDSPRNQYSPVEIFTLLRKGDSAIVVMSIETLQRHVGAQLPEFLRKKNRIFFWFKVLDVFTSGKQMEADSLQEVARQRERETRAIETYLASNHFQAEKTPMGGYFRIGTVGHGPTIENGKQVAFHFTCRLLPSGKIVQSNQNGSDDGPLKAVIGRGQLIAGVEDGLRHFREGGKGTLYIPAFLAYDAGRGPGGSTYEDLIFDIQVDKVTVGPPGRK